MYYSEGICKKPHIARSAQPERAYPLRQCPLNACPHSVLGLPGRRGLALTRRQQRFMFGARL
jgi:hypothetical protein